MENFPEHLIQENVIHVTGFGVFRGFTSTNPSWEAVKQLPDHIIHDGKAIQIVKHQVSVTYEAVDKKIHEIWSKKPKVSAIRLLDRQIFQLYSQFHEKNTLF